MECAILGITLRGGSSFVFFLGEVGSVASFRWINRAGTRSLTLEWRTRADYALAPDQDPESMFRFELQIAEWVRYLHLFHLF